jgi:hypothetical protein
MNTELQYRQRLNPWIKSSSWPNLPAGTVIETVDKWGSVVHKNADAGLIRPTTWENYSIVKYRIVKV